MEYYNTEMRCVLKVLFWMAINFFEIKTKEKMKILHKIKVKNMIDEILRYNSKCSQWSRFVQAEEKNTEERSQAFFVPIFKGSEILTIIFQKNLELWWFMTMIR